MEPKLIKPIVITSKIAQDKLYNIKRQHADIVLGMENHNVKVQAYNEKKDMEKKETEEKESVRMKEQLEAETKQRELDIKQQALSM